MKKLLFLLVLLPSFALCEGPKFQHDEPAIQQEFESVYQDIRGILTSTRTSKCIDNPTFCVDFANNRVGIGVSTAIAKLHVLGSGQSAVRVTDGSNYTLDIGYGGTGNKALLTTLGGTATLSLGTNSTERLLVNAGGEVTLPSQPSFLIFMSGTASNVTGDNGSYPVAFDSEITDRGSDVSGSTFTAPVSGNYLLTTTIDMDQLSTANHIECTVNIVTSNRTYTHQFSDIPTSLTRTQVSFSVVADMDANDIAAVSVKVDGTSKVVDVSGGLSLTRFSGALLN